MAISGERPMPVPGVPPRREKDHGPSQADIDAANAGQLAPKGVEKAIHRFARSKAVKLGLVGGAAVGAYQVPAIQRAVDSIYHDTLQKLGLEVPTSFDNKADKGVIGDNNIVKASLSEIQQQSPEPLVEKDNLASFLFPFQLPESARVTYGKTLSAYEEALIATLPPEARAEATKKGITDTVNFTLPKDTLIYTSVNGHILAASSKKTLENPNFADWARLFYYDETKDRTYVLSFGSTDPNAFDSLVPTQGNEPTVWRGTSWEQLPTIKQGTPILKTTKENQLVSINVRAYKGKIVGPQADIVDKTSYATTPQFLTTATPEGQKLLVLAK